MTQIKNKSNEPTQENKHYTQMAQNKGCKLKPKWRPTPP